MAMAEAVRYGNDPMVLFRELGQNARDAKASRIDIRTKFKHGLVRLEFSDNGVGMSFAHAKRYLFRLYASSKEQDNTSAGRFGVGFWSVLLARPKFLEVHSKTKENKWAVGLNAELTDWSCLSCRCRSSGTKVILWLNPGNDRAAVLKTIEQGIDRYLCHLRTADRKPRPLRVVFNARVINRPFGLDGPGTLRFRNGPVEGVVGLGIHPSYKLYARGLPVLDGAYLDELQGGTLEATQDLEPDGLAPVYVLNGDKLSVVLNRNTLVHNEALDHLIKVAKARFDELVQCTIDGPRANSGLGRIKYLFLRWLGSSSNMPSAYRMVLFSLALFILVALAGAGAIGVFSKTKQPVVQQPIASQHKTSASAGLAQAGKTPKTSPALDPLGSWENVRTATVAQTAGRKKWTFHYSSDELMMFRRMVLNSWDQALGWQISKDPDTWSKDFCSDHLSGLIDVDIPTGGLLGYFMLPIPTAYTLACDTGKQNGHKVDLFSNYSGLALVSIEDAHAGILSYQVVVQERVSLELLRTISKSPISSLPEALESKLAGWQNLDIAHRVKLAIDATDDLLAYDRGRHTIEEYKRRIDGKNDWLEEVLSIGAGDCDVINGVLVLALRRMGIASRLVAGIVGEGKIAMDGWHAWVEAVQEGKLVVQDATLDARLLSGISPLASSSAIIKPPIAKPGIAGLISRQKTHTSHANSQAGSSFEKIASDYTELWILTMALAAILLLALLVWIAPRHHSRLELSADKSERRKILVQMISDAIKRPYAWKGVYGIWHRKVLPCVDGRKISLTKLVHLGMRGKAFVGSADNELVKEATRSTVTVVDCDDEDFGALFEKIANLRDLNSISENAPVDFPKGIAGSLLSNIQKLLEYCSTGVSLAAVENWRKTTPFGDLDISPIKPDRKSKWTQSFIALDLSHDWWQEMFALYSRSPSIALCVVADRLASKSALLAEHANKIRLRVAEQQLEKMT